MEPTMSPPADGTVHSSPACKGESPSTNCKYCAMKKKAPPMAKMLNVFAASARAALPWVRRQHPGFDVLWSVVLMSFLPLRNGPGSAILIR
jgi:hypothetical protein